MNRVESIEDALRAFHDALEAHGCSPRERADVLDLIRGDAVSAYQLHMHASLHATDPGTLPDDDERTAREMACSSGLSDPIRMWANAVTNLGTRLDELRTTHAIARGYIATITAEWKLASAKYESVDVLLHQTLDSLDAKHANFVEVVETARKVALSLDAWSRVVRTDSDYHTFPAQAGEMSRALRAALPSALGGTGPALLRPEVLAFARAMERRLAENAHKGDSWRHMTWSAMITGLRQEASELQVARSWSSEHIATAAADVGNFAMFIAVVFGGLSAPLRSLDGGSGPAGSGAIARLASPVASQRTHRWQPDAITGDDVVCRDCACLAEDDTADDACPGPVAPRETEPTVEEVREWLRQITGETGLHDEHIGIDMARALLRRLEAEAAPTSTVDTRDVMRGLVEAASAVEAVWKTRGESMRVADVREALYLLQVALGALPLGMKPVGKGRT